MLELIGLTRRYGEVVALDELTFTVPPGQLFGFLVPNGAGKTTAMRAVFDLVKLDAGEVRWRGEQIGERERRGFGYMPEERGLYPGMRVLEQLVFLGRLHGLRAVQADAYSLFNGVLFGGASSFFHVLAFIPWTAPIAMTTMFAIGAAPAWQVLVSALLCVLATVATARLAGVVYRRSVMRTGARVKLRQVLRAGAA